MLASRFALPLLGLAFALGSPHAQAAPAIPIAIVDFSYLDTSGEAVDQSAAHQARLQAFMAALRRDFSGDGRFGPVVLSCGAAPCTVEGTVPEDLAHAASTAGAKILVLGGIHKLSTLVEWAKVQAIDVATDRVLVDRLFTFRGDNDEAWQRAESFLSDELRTALPGGGPGPTALAVFDFELEDYSAGAAADGAVPEDAAKLAAVAEAVRRRLAKSGRYTLVDTAAADAPAAKAHALHDCDGCDAAIARPLGAGQSLVGVVRRISRTEYMIRFQIRDTATGAVVTEAKSGLRMGADYSWDRGAVRLVEDQLLGEAGRP